MGSSPLKLVVFDCDGTLVDSQHNIITCMEASFTSNGLVAPAADKVRGIIGLNLDRAIYHLMEEKEDRELLGRLVDGYKQAFFENRLKDEHHEPLYDGVLETLEKLASQNILMAVATGKSLRGLNAVVEKHGLHDYFTSLQTPDHNPGKPHPQMAYSAMEAVGADPAHTYMVGDTSYDMQLAKNAGIHAVGVEWGYHDNDTLTQTGADHLISVADELIPIVSG